MKWDTVIVGSGFGGAMTAHALVAAGERVLMLERGDWVKRGKAAWEADASVAMTPSYALDIPYRCDRGGYAPVIGGYACVGGPSVYYGGVAFRFRERDFIGDPDVVGDSQARWPFDYSEIEPHYTGVERLLGISGNDGADPTRPYRSAPFPRTFPDDNQDLAPISARLHEAATQLRLHPFRLPLAINYVKTRTRNACWSCRTCDSFACAIEAKNDIATAMIHDLIERGMTLRERTTVTRIEHEGRIARRLHAWRRRPDDSLEAEVIETDKIVLAAGALGSPHLLLTSRLDRLAPNVGRYLMRHDNAMVYGCFPSRPDPGQQFHKQLAIHDWYFGDPGAPDAEGMTKLGGVQQVMTPPKGLVRSHLPLGTKTLLGAFTEQLTGLLCIAEDQPRADNRVTVDWEVRDVYGLPQLVIDHTYSERDRHASDVLVARAKRVLEETGALFSHVHRVKTFSHAVGTIRMGDDPETAPLDRDCKFRGLDNLWVTDGSAFPTSAGVNPSLTIAANALRAAGAICKSLDTTAVVDNLAAG
jgi:choline dehydrogenase-like flavoprotein